MTYTGSDPTNFVGGTDGVAYDTNVRDANLQHVIVTDSTGAQVDYIIVEGNGGDNEFWTIASDGTMTLQQSLSVAATESSEKDPYTVVQGNDGQTYLFDTDRDGATVLYFDSTTDQWVNLYFAEADLGHSGVMSLDVYVTDDGVIHAYTGDTNLANTLNQWVFDTTTKTFVPDGSYTMAGDLGMDQRLTTELNVRANEMEVLMTNDGPKLLVWNSSTAASVEGFTLYDIDPATGDLVANSAASYNFGSSADGGGLGLEVDFVTSNSNADELLYGQTGTITVDGNGNIVMTTGSWSTSESGAYGMIVIDPSLAVKDIDDQDGDGDVDQSASIVKTHFEIGSKTIDGTTVPSTAWGSNAQISYSPDGKYMYITSENTTGSGDPEDTTTIVIDAKTYDIVTFGTDTTSGYYSSDPTNDGATTATNGAESQIIATLSTGEQYYIGQFWDTANSVAGWLSVSSVDANLVTVAPVVCFVAGTHIKTEIGDVAIEKLKIGDRVLTKNHGYQKIRWIGSSIREAVGRLAPILIREGALGNTRDLRVSPQHRMLISGWQAELLFGESEVLVAAQHLVNDHSIIRIEGGKVEYYHILFDEHEIIFAENCPSESFLPGAEGQKSLSSAQAKEIFELFPELEGRFENYGDSCRPTLKAFEGRMIAETVMN